MRKFCGLLLCVLCGLTACQPILTRPQAAGSDGPFHLLVVEQGCGQVKVFDSNGTLLDSTRVGHNPHEVEVDPMGQTAYVSNFGVEDYDNTLGTPGTTISVLDLADLSKQQTWPTYRPGVAPADTLRAPHGVKLRPPAYTELYVNLEHGDSMLVYDTGSGEILRSFPIAAGNHNFEFSPSGDIVWLLAGANGVYRYDARTGQETGHFRPASPVRGLNFSANREDLILSGANEINILNTADLSLHRRITDLDIKQIVYSCLSPDGRLLFAPCPLDNVVLVIDLESGEVLHRLTCGKAPIYVRLAPNGTEAFVANALDDHLSVIRLSDFSVRRFGNVIHPNGFVFLTL